MRPLSKHQHHNLRLVQLADGILVNTPISSACIPALRSGFAGYPVNPRWNAMKYHAWKTGRQWRQALSRGEMAVRTGDSTLVSVSEQEDPVGSTRLQQWPGLLSLVSHHSQLKLA